jgi:hypothetical protein
VLASRRRPWRGRRARRWDGQRPITLSTQALLPNRQTGRRNGVALSQRLCVLLFVIVPVALVPSLRLDWIGVCVRWYQSSVGAGRQKERLARLDLRALRERYGAKIRRRGGPEAGC